MAALFAIGCAPQEPAAPSGSAETPAANEAPAAAGESAGSTASASDSAATADALEIVIEANDQMQFSIENFVVAPGQTVRLTLDNVGTMPKFSMGHNVVILVKDADAAAFVDAATTAAANEYIPEGSEDQIVAHTALLGGGEEDTITFTAPEAAGDYPFVCSFPGHFQIGMAGTMTVQ